MNYGITLLNQTSGQLMGGDESAPEGRYGGEIVADVLIVGAGLSGLAAAYFYQRRFGPQSRVLIVDAAEHVGGMTRRIDFEIDGHNVVTNGGAVAFEGVETWTSPVVAALLDELDLGQPESKAPIDPVLDQLSRFIHVRNLGTTPDAVLEADALLRRIDVDSASGDWQEAVHRLPFPSATRGEFEALWGGTLKPARNNVDLSRTSYRDFLISTLGLSSLVADFLDRRTIGTFGSPAACVPAADALAAGLPGAAYRQRYGVKAYTWTADSSLTYPGGLAAVASALRERITRTAGNAGGTIEIRLRHRALRLRNEEDGVSATVAGPSAWSAIRTRDCVFAGSAQQMGVVMDDIDPAVRDASRSVVKPPMCYVAVAVRNWEAFAALGAGQIWSPDAFFYDIALRPQPGGRPHEPAAVELVYRPIPDPQLSDFRLEADAATKTLMNTSLSQFRNELNGQLGTLLGAHGFDPERDISSVIVNSWPHTYSPALNTLVDDPDTFVADMEDARRPNGRIAIAGADSHRFGWAQAALDAAERAVNDLPTGRPEARL